MPLTNIEVYSSDWTTIFIKFNKKNILMPCNCDYLILTIKTKRSYPRQHTCSEMHKNLKFLACKVIWDNKFLKSLT